MTEKNFYRKNNEEEKIMVKPLSLIFILLIMILIIPGCRPIRDCPVKFLLLSVNEFPKGAKAEGIISPISDEPEESAWRRYKSLNDVVYQEVIRHLSNKAAKDLYDRYLNSMFKTGENYGPWEKPSELDFSSSAASNYKVSCGNLDGIRYMCILDAQYQEYSILLTSSISDQGITVQDFNVLLNAVDRRMELCLNK